MIHPHRAVILPVVLLVLLLLGLLVAMFAFRVNADLAATRVISYQMQTRLAAEAGIDRVRTILRESRFDVDRWFDNTEELHRVLVWGPDGDEAFWGTNEEFDDGAVAFRFSIVADDATDDETYIRFGVTDESSKLHLNRASASQLLKIVQSAAGDDPDIQAKEIVAAIIDWRDADGKVSGEATDTEGEYYRRLDHPYQIKNAPFDTVEELLLVKGVTARLLYGEDYDRNGLLTANEDDGDDSFPPDNADGLLNLGMYPYLTVLSSENNVSNEGRQRAFLFGDAEELRAELALAFPQEPSVVDFIVSATRAPTNRVEDDANTENDGGESEDDTEGSGNTENDDDGSGADSDGGGATGESRAGATGRGGRTGSGSNGGPVGQASIPSPASLLRDQLIGEVTQRSIVTMDHLPVLLDRTTTLASDRGPAVGLININTAGRLVLECIEELTSDEIDRILELRDRLSSEARATPAWLLSEEVVDLDKFELIGNKITARGQQFNIESLGYGDHIGTVTRLQVVVDLAGPVAQPVYYRDLTYLNGHYPIRKDDLEQSRGR